MKRERRLETACTKLATKHGWVSIKLYATGQRGVPDRLYFKDGQAIFVEFKVPGGVLAPTQEYWAKVIRAQQMPYYLIITMEDFKNALNI